MSSIRLRGEAIEKRYGRIAALRGVDFEIAPGESLSILGANGAGKSSLLRILAGLSRASAGRFEAFACDSGSGSGSENEAAPAPEAPGATAGEPPSRSSAAKPRRLDRTALRGAVGYVGHATLVYGELTARENLAFAARLHGQRPDRDRLDALLADFSLLEFAERRAGSFSRGMAQRLSIARAVVHGPRLLLLDEPFTGLDESSAEQLAERLAQQRAAGRTLVVVTHDPRRAVTLSERAIVLHRGSVRATPARATSPAEFEVEALRETLGRLARETSAGADAPRRAAG